MTDEPDRIAPASPRATKVSQRVARLATRLSVALPHELTYNSTVASLCEAAGLQRVVMPLGGRKAWRFVFLSAAFTQWLEGLAAGAVGAEAVPPRIQVESVFYGFCDGKAAAYGHDIRCLKPVDSAVWELKTDDLRIFGWFACKNHFVADRGAFRNHLRTFKDYAPHVAAVAKWRDEVTPPLPGWETGTRTQDVVSNRP